ncbi:glutamic acid-rich protein-like [Ptychodera flava]|uniref:glutamic acid-rich protein-like n=1 Tax=Ptychodera flava TaxID=63121 RepID=UPI00396A4E2E
MSDDEQCVQCSKSFQSPLHMTCNHKVCNECAEDIHKKNEDAHAEEFHCPGCNKGVIHQAKKKGNKKESNQTEDRRIEYVQKKGEIIKNLEELQRENDKLDDFVKKLNVIGEKTKVNASQLRNEIVKECDALVLIIERRKRVMLSKVDKAQQEKLRTLETQMRTCKQSQSKGHAVVVRTNRDLERMPQVTLITKADSINTSITDARESHPELTPKVDDKIRYKLDFQATKDQLEQLDLEEVEDDEEEGKEGGDKGKEGEEGEEKDKEKEEEEGEKKDGENEDKGDWTKLQEEKAE